jgi:DNA (cytosine-5)-methyltransferase 1
VKPSFLRTAKFCNLKKNQLTIISLFSGAGGMDLGCMQAGFEVRVMIDWDINCCETLRANFTGPHRLYQKRREPVILHRDICKTTTAELLEAAELQVGEAGVVTGGFPCPGFSVAGRRMINDPRNKLYKECVRVVREALPRFFIFENVPGIISMKRGLVINQICRDLACCGYDVWWQKLNAADFGVPQHRIRVFFIGLRNDMLYWNGKDNPQLHMGVAGRYKHPEFFEKKYKIPSHWPEAGALTGASRRAGIVGMGRAAGARNLVVSS